MTGNVRKQSVLILDFGSQYTQLIARRVREAGVYSEIHHWDLAIDKIRAFAPAAIILSGGPDTVTTGYSPRLDDSIFELDIPLLAICYGMQLMARQLGGKVRTVDRHEYGHALLTLKTTTELLGSAGSSRSVWMSHGDSVVTVPPGFEVTASSDNTPIAAIADVKRDRYGLQFHPEVTHTDGGAEMIARFVCQIAGCAGDWQSRNIIDEAVAKIRQQVDGRRVLLALSGGVDSAVAAALLQRAIGQQLVCVFVDNGLLRLHEAEQVIETFREGQGIEMIAVDAKERFLKALKGSSDPEEKRRIIGNTFIDVFEQEAQRLGQIELLGQGTIYPDVIESAGAATGSAKVIKSHHNVGGLPERMKLELVEPLRELFKDEVRMVGRELGLPEAIVGRHPFPGPGLGVRILGEIRREYIKPLQQADYIYISELHKADLYNQISQAFAVLLPVKSVGVTGDGRRYEPVIALRAVVTDDFMTARAAQFPHEFLARVAGRIINEVPGISRVVYDISDKPPATIEWE